MALALLAAFVARQARVANPLMPLRLFHSRNVTGANIVIALLVVGMFGMFFLGALYLQRIEGYDPLQVGLAFLPSTVVMGTMSLRVSGPLVMRFGAKLTLIASLVSIGVGLLLFSLTPVDATFVTQIMPATIFIGIGAGLGFPSLMMLAMSGATPEDSGLASGLINTSVQVGGAIGLAVLATLATERTSTLRADGESINAALNGGYHLAYLIGAALVGVAIVVAATVLRSGSPAAAQHRAPSATATRSRRTPTRSEYDRRVPDRLYFTDSDEANALIASDPMALLVGFALDQQVTVQKAFAGPLVVRERLGALDAATLAVRRSRGGVPREARDPPLPRRRWPSASTRSRCTCATPTTATPRASGPRPPTGTRCAPTWPPCPASAR